ncbi:MAG: hypothetical protein HRU04_05440 [Oceanospirillaceae bacterium]|nr:hypothetical protein [Oceanospirillaceae bacterium]
MQTLAIVVGEDTFYFSKKIDSLPGGFKAYPDMGVNIKHLGTITTMTKVTTKWATSSYQNITVGELNRESDSALQTTLMFSDFIKPPSSTGTTL